MPATIVEAEQALVQGPDAPAVLEPPVDETPPRLYSVFHQQVSLDIDLREKSVKGHANIFISSKAILSEVFIDARQCDIDVANITVSSCPAKATYDDPYHKVDTPEAYQWSAPQWGIRKQRMRPLLYRRRKTECTAFDHEDQIICQPADESLRVEIPPLNNIRASLAKLKEARNYGRGTQPDQYDKAVEDSNGALLHKITIPFTLRNIRDGLHFVGIDEADTRYPHVYTQHSFEAGTACSIFPCIDDPACRSNWKVSITFPRTLGDAFHQPLVTQQPPTNGVSTTGSRKRKHGEDEPRRRNLALTEEDKLLELTAICSGKLEDEVINKDDETKKTMTFTCSSKAAHHIGFALGPFEHVDLWSEFRTEEDDEKLGSNATKIHGYCLPGRAEEVRNTCAAIVTAIDHFAMNFGRYPFDNYKMCFVDDMVADTAPLCGFSLCSNRMLFPREIIDIEIDVTRTLVHALASQWFGVFVIANEKSDIWLVAGISWFMTDLFMKALCGNNEYRFRMKALADRLVEIDMSRPSLHSLGEHLHLGDFQVDFMNMKAALVLFILDRRLSKSSGSAGIARIIAKMVSKANINAGGGADEILISDNFRKHCEKHGQTKLDGFWNQWVVGSGCPRFDIYQKFNKKRICVEMSIKQMQDAAGAKARQLDKDAFWKDVIEENHAVWAGDLQHCFTGPMTIRIHEADGTPYEHIIELREDGQKTTKYEVPYNTKYKRLKRNRRQRERQITGNAGKPNEDADQDSLLYCLGDVLQTLEDIDHWHLEEWGEAVEAKMDQESYEWIRMDADFEWICTMQTNMPPYMYVSQLQQDKDVVAQQDSMLYLSKEAGKNAHPLISTILTRTLMDARYFHGIRALAAQILSRLGGDNLPDRIGLKHLLMTFQQAFCYGEDKLPRPNDFSDKRQYMIQCAIPEAVAQVRDKDGTCPREARRFILQLLQCNNNAENMYSDHIYICKLIGALATCQIPDEKHRKKQTISFAFGDQEDDEQVIDPEPNEFKELALEEVERYRRMDEYSPSFQNCFTVAALDALCRLMKANVIPSDPLVFTQYLQDGTIDVVRIKSFEALVDLGFMSQPTFLRFFLSVISTDSSPFIRDRLFKAFCRGLASIAFGENAEAEKEVPVPNEGGLIIEQASSITEANQKLKDRKQDLSVALAALKDVTKDDKDLQEVVWTALDSPVISVAERRNLLELCSILFEEDESLMLKFKYPKVWTLMMDFKRYYRTKSRKTYAAPAIRSEQPKRTITLNVNKAASFSAPKPKPVIAATPQPTPVPNPSISSAALKATNAANAPRSAIVGSQVLSQSPQQSTPTTVANTSFSSPPPLPTQSTATPPSQSQTSANGSSAKPARKPLPSGERKPLPSSERKSLPSGGRTSLPSAAPQSAPPQPPPNSESGAAAPPKTKFKIKVKQPTQ
ncbi:hypothetical protein BJ170DRAFT_582341 [Xylariales sp. AK1849]|nr:hypothetical protein BJ170DRAFT_582341 [Xylariales sp. AK1849]